ncbi:hypothetical protein CK203_111101 [Vitis vinifera]|uniref:Retrovirus-related Pol polyprotein from transposon 17.6 n=1 Tax=Vitis vinifera TaxID=29760 RepID=A0A438FGU5_VITVI|nr:hypothetical protein CK203_111101 [Vitis vinifera]
MSCCDIFISDQSSRELFNGSSQEVVRAEVLKLLQAGIIYPISDSPWVSPTQVVPKKSGITVVQNEKGEEITTRLTSSWRRMPFGLCNAPATFQRCMLSIFSDMVERIMEVFMDDITVYGGIVLGHIISEKGIEVDKAKWSLLSNYLPNNCESCTWPKEDGKPYVIYYAIKTLNEAQRNYTTTEKELLAMMDSLLQEFDLQIKDKKGVENVVADHLSRSDHKEVCPEDEQQGILFIVMRMHVEATLPLRKQP